MKETDEQAAKRLGLTTTWPRQTALAWIRLARELQLPNPHRVVEDCIQAWTSGWPISLDDLAWARDRYAEIKGDEG